MLDDILAPLFNTDWGQRLGWTLMICMLLLCVWLIVNSFITWHGDYVLTHPSNKTEVFNLPTNAVTKLIAEIPEEHIFGKYNQVESATLPITSLQLQLVGVIKSEPEKFSRVIISEGSKPGKVYQVGDEVSPDVKVNAIASDGVILENGGRLEKLPLQRAPLLFRGPPKSFLPNENFLKEH